MNSIQLGSFNPIYLFEIQFSSAHFISHGFYSAMSV